MQPVAGEQTAGRVQEQERGPAVAQVSKETGVPLLMDTAGADTVTKWDRTPTVVRTAVSASQIGHPWGDYLYKELGLRNVTWRIQVSRVATFQSISVVAILFYIITMMLAARAIEIVGGDWARIGQVLVVLGMTLAALLILPSARLRAWLRVTLAKHLFEHRYDYRQEWLRFTDTMVKGGAPGEGNAPLEERVVKALADIGGAPGGRAVCLPRS